MTIGTRIVLPPGAGVVAVGPYRVGQVLEVGVEIDEREATRLVEIKGFAMVSGSPEPTESEEE